MSKRWRKRVLTLIVFLVVGGLVFGWYWLVSHRKAAIHIETVPDSQVYVDNEYVGRTPYEGEFEKREIILKLVPESFEGPMAPYETRMILVSGVKTVVRRMFGIGEEGSFGEEISFERLGGDESSAAVISDPDGAKGYWDGKMVDVTPLRLDGMVSGAHQLTISADGYDDRSFSVQVVKGYKVTVNVKLKKVGEVAGDNVEELATNGEDSEEKKIHVEILETPIGFLRVRQEPSVESAEIGRVNPGEEYEVMEKNEAGNWFKINLFEAQKSGWVSAEYVKEVKPESESLRRG